MFAFPCSDVLLADAHKQIFQVAENLYQCTKATHHSIFMHLLFDGRDIPAVQFNNNISVSASASFSTRQLL